MGSADRDPDDAAADGLTLRLLGSGDANVLGAVAADVFDHSIDPSLAGAFLDDPRHHIAVAIEGRAVVGFISAVDYVHPDKPRELWINEVGVAPSHQGRGLGKALMELLLEHARRMGCAEAWVLTDDSNAPANALYRSAGGCAHEPPRRMYSFQLSAKDATAS